MSYSVLDGEPGHKVREFVGDLAGRRDECTVEMAEAVSKLVQSLFDTIAMMKRHDPGIDLRSITFERVRWLRDGRIMFDIHHRGRPMPSRDVGW